MDLVRLCQGNQMSNRPGDHIAVSLEIAFTPLVGSEGTCNVSCDGGLFGQDRNGAGFNCAHRNISLPSSSAECAFEVICKLKLREGMQEDAIIKLARKHLAAEALLVLEVSKTHIEQVVHQCRFVIERSCLIGPSEIDNPKTSSIHEML